MMNLNKLFIALAFLIGVNICLGLYYRQVTNDLSLAHSTLSRDDVFEFINDRKHLSLQIERLGVESTVFSETLDSMILLAAHHSQETTSYFEPAALMDEQIQELLWRGYRDFHESSLRYLEMKLPKAKVELSQKLNRVSLCYAAIEARAKRTPNGLQGDDLLDLAVASGETFNIRLQWRKSGDSIHWSDSRAYYFKYSTRLEEMIRASDAYQTRKLLKKMEKTFPRPGVVVVFGIEYCLSNLSPAELASICKFVGLLTSEVQASIMATHSEVTLFD
jgi:hypothetical protein